MTSIGHQTNPFSRNQRRATTRNESIKAVGKWPSSTHNRIVFLPNTTGVGFQCCQTRIRNTAFSDQELEPDERMIRRLNPVHREAVLNQISAINQMCYAVWKSVKNDRERFPFEKEYFLLRATAVLTFTVFVFFFVNYQENGSETWVFDATFGMFIALYGLMIITILMIVFKKYQNQDFDDKIKVATKQFLEKLNHQDEHGLIWRNPKGCLWIYVTVPTPVTLTT